MLFDAVEKERLIEEFSAFLETCESGDEAEQPVDLHTLLAEMAALKNEIRLESRQFKSMLDEMRSFANVLREQNERLNRDLEMAREQTAAGKQKAERALLLEMLDLRDRLQAGRDAGEAHKPSWLARLIPDESRFNDSLVQGMALTLQRVDDALTSHRVRPLTVTGLPLDPHMMRAVGIETDIDKPDGVVLREARRGFYHGSELLRAAEVIVNKRAE
jgi:molecular chaperone GrpE